MKRRGFTLVELVVVITVIGILAAALVPAFASVIKFAAEAADRTQLNELRAMLQTGDINPWELKEYELQTKGRVLAYNEEQGDLVIIDEKSGEIVAANDSSKVGQQAEGYKKVGEIEKPEEQGGGEGSGEGGGEGSGSGEGSEEGGGSGEGSEEGGGSGEGSEEGGGSTLDERWKDAKQWEEIKDESVRKDAKKIYIGDEITEEIPASYFSGCAVEEIYIGKGITKLPKSVFSGCASLKAAEIAGELTEIGDYAFSKCVCLKELKLPKSLKTIYRYTFNGCSFDKLIMPGLELPVYDEINVNVREFTIDGGQFTQAFKAFILSIIRNGVEKIIIKDIYFYIEFDDSPFKTMTENMSAEVSSEIYQKIMKYNWKDPFGKASVTQI